MPQFEIENELHCLRYRVVADSEAAAIVKLWHGAAEAMNDGLEFIEVANDWGLYVEENRELAQQLRTLGVDTSSATLRLVKKYDPCPKFDHYQYLPGPRAGCVLFASRGGSHTCGF